MSENNRAGGRTARERLAEERAREQAAERRRRTLKVLGISVATLAVVGGIGFAAGNTGRDSATAGPPPEPIAQGPADAPATLTVYEDFRCPACARFETYYKDTISDLQDEGKLRTEYHLVTIIDDGLGGEGSTRAANAAICAEDAGRFPEYHDLLFAEQPAERSDEFADPETLIELAGRVEGLDTDSFRDCVLGETHADRVARTNTAFRDSEYGATPTVLLNGESVYGDPSDPLTVERLRERVEEIAGG
ncbi:DsbA family protein [Streptomyces calidiresistens]|uniref:Thioredoxin domain-containing protein n=1 Tax=Streptomyces calidiresistens TaxID=1485586 RepID=A0A7W3T7X4_9ACTN|nr:thioredoxin domain-containing protein [Streptomyces calidiresistens]MBB0232316.1 thioredoxin domain-containing protein [Streptomyces calidiresistens]